MDDDIPFIITFGFIVWVAVVSWFIGNRGYISDLADKCVKGGEFTIEATVFECKPIALVSKGIKAEIK